MRPISLAALVLTACVTSESGNPAQRCDTSASCGLAQVCYRGFCVEDGVQQVDPLSSEAAEDASAVEPDAAVVSSATAVVQDASVATADDKAAPFSGDAGPVTADAEAPPVVPPTVEPLAPPTVEPPGVPVDEAVEVDAPDAGPEPTSAAVPDAGSPPPDAGTGSELSSDAGACRGECTPPGQNYGKCKKCVEEAFDVDPEELCGKPKGRAEDRPTQAAVDPLCTSLCLGASAADPSCTAASVCGAGERCGGGS